MTSIPSAALHDAYAADYDAQVVACDCHIADVLFGLCYEYVKPGQRLLDAGIGTGLSAVLFGRAGLDVYGMDFSPAMLELCRAKGFAADLNEHDLRAVPWPYPPGTFDHATCCGVFHFILELDPIFAEVGRVLGRGGKFSFTTRMPRSRRRDERYARGVSGGFEIFSHNPAYVEASLAAHSFALRKRQRCYVGEDLFVAWVTQLQ